MKTIGEIIKNLRLERRMSQEQLAKELNVATSAIGMWENNNRIPTDETKEAIADFFNVDMNYLYGKSPVRNSYAEAKMYTSAGIDFIRVPLYPPICCGNGGFVDDDIIELVPVPSKGLSSTGDYFCQIASGDSMKDAGIEDGDLLVFEKAASLDYGKIGCFCIDDNEAMCKKYTVVNGLIILQPMNSDYEPIIVDPLNESFKCVGVLKKSIKDFSNE